MMNNTVEEIANWMIKEVQEVGILKQELVISYIKEHYGDQYIYMNENGNESIDKEVKKIFKKLHKGRVAWDREGFFWAWT